MKPKKQTTRLKWKRSVLPEGDIVYRHILKSGIELDIMFYPISPKKNGVSLGAWYGKTDEMVPGVPKDIVTKKSLKDLEDMLVGYESVLLNAVVVTLTAQADEVMGFLAE